MLLIKTARYITGERQNNTIILKNKTEQHDETYDIGWDYTIPD
jgi:hypothetical protein